MFRAVLFDLDGTLTTTESVWRHLHERLGLWDGGAERHLREFQEGRITYEEFCRLDAACWKGLPVSRLEAIAAEIGYREGAVELVGSLKSRHLRLGVISTGLTLLSDRVGRELGIEDCVANHLVTDRGIVTGAVEIRVIHGRKDRAVADFCRRHGLRPEEVIAVGDSEGDVSMFRRAGFAIAFHARDEAVKAAADRVCGGGPLTELLPLLPLRGTGVASGSGSAPSGETRRRVPGDSPGRSRGGGGTGPGSTGG